MDLSRFPAGREAREAPMLALTNAIQEGGSSPAPLACVPSLVYLDSHGIPLQTPVAPLQPMAKLANQDLHIRSLRIVTAQLGK